MKLKEIHGMQWRLWGLDLLGSMDGRHTPTGFLGAVDMKLSELHDIHLQSWNAMLDEYGSDPNRRVFRLVFWVLHNTRRESSR